MALLKPRKNKVELRLILNSVTVFYNWFDIFQTLTTFEKLLILATVADYLHVAVIIGVFQSLKIIKSIMENRLGIGITVQSPAQITATCK